MLGWWCAMALGYFVATGGEERPGHGWLGDWSFVVGLAIGYAGWWLFIGRDN